MIVTGPFQRRDKFNQDSKTAGDVPKQRELSNREKRRKIQIGITCNIPKLKHFGNIYYEYITP